MGAAGGRRGRVSARRCCLYTDSPPAHPRIRIRVCGRADSDRCCHTHHDRGRARIGTRAERCTPMIGWRRCSARSAGPFLNLALLLIPLAVAALHMFFVPPCDWLEGLGFYLLIPVVTVLVSSALGLFCADPLPASTVMAALFIAATVAYAVALGYFTPAIFSYNLVLRVLPGCHLRRDHRAQRARSWCPAS